jgi:hypothetical protein
MKRVPRTLIYKRTHTGDPDPGGRFGINGCMGRVRAWDFEAVIGVGGMGPEPTSHSIDGRVTWIGIGPRRSVGRDHRGPLVTFDHFLLMDATGPEFAQYAPRLAARIYSRNIRATVTLVSDVERAEVVRLLRLARRAPPSPIRTARDRAASMECTHTKSRDCRCGQTDRRGDDTARVDRSTASRSARRRRGVRCT